MYCRCDWQHVDIILIEKFMHYLSCTGTSRTTRKEKKISPLLFGSNVLVQILFYVVKGSAIRVSKIVGVKDPDPWFGVLKVKCPLRIHFCIRLCCILQPWTSSPGSPLMVKWTFELGQYTIPQYLQDIKTIIQANYIFSFISQCTTNK